MMHSTYKLSKQGDKIQPWRIPFPIWNQSVVPCLVLTVASWPAYRFLRRQVRWSEISISWRIFHSLLWSTQSKAVLCQWRGSKCFLGFFFFFYVANLVSDSSAFPKYSLNVWKFLVHVRLKPSLKDFERYFASMQNEHNYVVVWTFFGICLSLGLKWKLTFSSPVAIADFQMFWHIECSNIVFNSIIF